MTRQEQISLGEAATRLLVNSLGLKGGESCLVVSDPSREDLGRAAYGAAMEITSSAKIRIIPPPGPAGWQPPNQALLEEELPGYDVILLMTVLSLSHTTARRQAVKRGARLASMPGITEDILIRAALADYRAVSKKANRLKAVF